MVVHATDDDSVHCTDHRTEVERDVLADHDQCMTLCPEQVVGLEECATAEHQPAILQRLQRIAMGPR